MILASAGGEFLGDEGVGGRKPLVADSIFVAGIDADHGQLMQRAACIGDHAKALLDLLNDDFFALV